MKKIIIATALLFALTANQSVQAQDSTKGTKAEIKDAGKKVKKGAQKAGQKSAEVASKGKAKVTDSVYKDKVGPNGETIYIDNHSRYYWVNKQGRRQYILEAEMKDKNK